MTDPRSNSPAVPGPAFYWQLDQGSVGYTRDQTFLAIILLAFSGASPILI